MSLGTFLLKVSADCQHVKLPRVSKNEHFLSQNSPIHPCSFLSLIRTGDYLIACVFWVFSANPPHSEQVLLWAGPATCLWAPSAGKFKISRAQYTDDLSPSTPRILSINNMKGKKLTRWDSPHLQHTSNKLQRSRKSSTVYFLFSKWSRRLPQCSLWRYYKHLKKFLECLDINFLLCFAYVTKSDIRVLLEAFLRFTES